VLAFSPLIHLLTPTQLGFEVGWVLVTAANLVVYVLIVAVFFLGATIRLPGAKRDLARVEAEAAASRNPPPES
jgi:uncharacterized membrane protein YciS (DUF1049 family)